MFFIIFSVLGNSRYTDGKVQKGGGRVGGGGLGGGREKGDGEGFLSLKSWVLHTSWVTSPQALHLHGGTYQCEGYRTGCVEPACIHP